MYQDVQVVLETEAGDEEDEEHLRINANFDDDGTDKSSVDMLRARTLSAVVKLPSSFMLPA